jgi:hypothetical protein
MGINTGKGLVGSLLMHDLAARLTETQHVFVFGESSFDQDCLESK